MTTSAKVRVCRLGELSQRWEPWTSREQAIPVKFSWDGDQGLAIFVVGRYVQDPHVKLVDGTTHEAQFNFTR